MDNSEMMGTEGKPAGEEKLGDRLADEYKILQDKIDKIGGFRFTIKGWSITVILGALFAGSTTNSLPRVPWLISLLVFLALFFLVEKEQTDLSYHFGQRAISIEIVLSRILRSSIRKSKSNDFVLLHFVPGIGHHLGRQHLRRKGPRSKFQSFRDADMGFYLVQAAVVLAVVLMHGGSHPVSSDQRGGGTNASAPVSENRSSARPELHNEQSRPANGAKSPQSEKSKK